MQKQNKIKFSVLIPVYYRENSTYFDDALKSVLNQTLLPNEIVIVEDGPLGNDLINVIKKYNKLYPNTFNVIKLKKNYGISYALKKGVENCNFNYIARMDSDDISEESRFEKQIKYLESNPKVDILGTNIVEFDHDLKNQISRKIVPETHDLIKTSIKKRNPINHMSVIMKKNMLIRSGNYEQFPYFEDYYLWCKLLANNSLFHNLQEDLVKVRGGKGMFKRRGGLKYIIYIIKFEYNIYKMDIINFTEFVTNLIIRISFSLIPNSFRERFYNKLLREQV